jgi:hypothetical protein
MSWWSSAGARISYGGVARSSVRASIRCLVSRPVSVIRPALSMRPRSRILSATAVSVAAGRWWIRPNFSAGVPWDIVYSACDSSPPMPSETRADDLACAAMHLAGPLHRWRYVNPMGARRVHFAKQWEMVI